MKTVQKTSLRVQSATSLLLRANQRLEPVLSSNWWVLPNHPNVLHVKEDTIHARFCKETRDAPAVLLVQIVHRQARTSVCVLALGRACLGGSHVAGLRAKKGRFGALPGVVLSSKPEMGDE